MRQHNTVAYTVAATVQHEATIRHAATHKTVAYTVAATVQHEATVQHAVTHNTVAYTVAATVQHEAIVWHAATHNTVTYTVGFHRYRKITTDPIPIPRSKFSPIQIPIPIIAIQFTIISSWLCVTVLVEYIIVQ